MKKRRAGTRITSEQSAEMWRMYQELEGNISQRCRRIARKLNCNSTTVANHIRGHRRAHESASPSVLRQERVTNLNLDSPSAKERAWLTYLPESLQERFDALVAEHLKWTPITSINNRRMWAANSLGTVGNLTAARFLEELGVDWREVLMMRKAA